ncbi:unnamed protein product [Phyllotreta striolata]|uniref:Uncharacterized protein n=1 Tax=Phyllotreta striolata TaxID=444603 RepID=A0A9N9TTN5_PHYSR|nr:unnamed protein product [Phyllotreta striolata]
MGDEVDITNRFYNIQGDTVSERKKYFYELLNSLKSCEEHVYITLENLQPRNYQESIFYVDALLYFKRTNRLLELMKSGNELYTSKILKNQWFFEQTFKDVEPFNIVNELLPCLSFSIRKKFISRLIQSWDSNRINHLFDELVNKYGITEAVIILHKCTEEKLSNVLTNNEVSLRQNQLIDLINTNERAFVSYIEHFNNLNGQRYDESKVINHLSRTNTQLFIKLLKNKKISHLQLGRRTTKTLVPKVKEDFLANSEFYLKFVNRPAAVRKLGGDFKVLYQSTFPRNFKDINGYCISNILLESYPKGRRWNLFTQTCQEKFPDKSLNDILLSYNNSVKKLNPPKEVFLKWAELHYQQQEGHFEDFLKYYEPNTCIPMIKEKINLTKEIRQRQILIKLMLQSCSQNKDLNALEQVLNYFCFRHRNEDVNFRQVVLRYITDNFKLEDLNEKHWKYINEQIEILRLQNAFHFFSFSDFVEKYLEFLFKNKKDHKEALDQYIEDLSTMLPRKILNLNNLPIEQAIFIEIAKIVSKHLNKDHEQSVLAIKMFFNIIKFSTSHPNYRIDLNEFPDFIAYSEKMFTTKNFSTTNQKLRSEQLKLILKLTEYYLAFPDRKIIVSEKQIIDALTKVFESETRVLFVGDIFKKFVSKSNRNALENALMTAYFDKLFEMIPDANVVNWFLKEEPSTIAPYFDKILTKVHKGYLQLDYKLVRHCSHLKFDEKICDYFTNKLEEKEVSEKKRLIAGLSMMLSTEEFKKIIEEKYLPTKDKLDLKDENMKNLYHLQCEIVKLAGNTLEVYKMLPTIMKFCRGDYLQSALSALYKAFYRSPEKLLYPYAEALSKLAVSVRKHAVFLSCQVLSKEYALEILKHTNETNKSSHKHLFSATLKYFLKNPSDELLDKLMENMKAIDKDDAETLNSLAYLTVPVKYRCRYSENCWRFFEDLALKGLKVQVYLEQLLRKMKGDIAVSLTPEFVSYLISKYCFEGGLNRANEFAMEILVSRVSERDSFFALTFETLSKKNVGTIVDFFRCFSERIRQDGFDDHELANLFCQYWTKYFNIVDYLSEHIELNVRLIRLNKPPVDVFASKIVSYVDTLLADFGFHVYEFFKNVFTEAIVDLNGPEYYELMLGILKCKLNPTTCILVLDCLSDSDSLKAPRIHYQNVLDAIDGLDSLIVKAHKKAYLRNHNF